MADKLLRRHGADKLSLLEQAKLGCLPEKLTIDQIVQLYYPNDRALRSTLREILLQAAREKRLAVHGNPHPYSTSPHSRDRSMYANDPHPREGACVVQRSDFEIHLKAEGSWPLPGDNLLASWWAVMQAPPKIRRRKPIQRENSKLVCVHAALDRLEEENQKTPPHSEVWRYLMAGRDTSGLVATVKKDEIELTDRSRITKETLRKLYARCFFD